MNELNFNEYMALVEQAPIMIWRANQEKLCDYFNTRWLQFTGRTMEQEYGNGWADGVHPDDFARCLNIYVTNFDKRQIFEMRYRLRRHDGEFRYIFDRGVPFFDNNKSFLGYIGSCIDIHETVQAEEELKKINEAKIKDLETLLPLCAWCKKMRTEKGDWIGLEQYLSVTKQRSITHSICPGCKKNLQIGDPR